jgi:hypothetical protein
MLCCAAPLVRTNQHPPPSTHLPYQRPLLCVTYVTPMDIMPALCAACRLRTLFKLPSPFPHSRPLPPRPAPSTQLTSLQCFACPHCAPPARLSARRPRTPSPSPSTAPPPSPPLPPPSPLCILRHSNRHRARIARRLPVCRSVAHVHTRFGDRVEHLATMEKPRTRGLGLR